MGVAGWLFWSKNFAPAAVFSHIVAASPKSKLLSASTPAEKVLIEKVSSKYCNTSVYYPISIL